MNSSDGHAAVLPPEAKTPANTKWFAKITSHPLQGCAFSPNAGPDIAENLVWPLAVQEMALGLNPNRVDGVARTTLHSCVSCR